MTSQSTRLLVAGLLLAFLSISSLPARASDESEATPNAELLESQVPEGHSHFGEAFNEGPRQAAYLMGTTGKVDFPVTTTSPEAQAFVNQGVGQLHGFWYFEAERSFRQAAAIDPGCTMAYWGMAMANFEGNKDRAKKFIEKAGEQSTEITDRERQWIEGLADYLKSYEEDRKKAARVYIRSLEGLIHDDPSDLEAKAFLAVRLWHFNRDLPINSHQAVDSLLELIFQVEPMHPAHHYRIHLWDREKPERALGSAARCGQAAPGIAHMWHMPNHIYSRLHRYADAVWQQSASSRVDHAQMIRDQVLPDQIHNYAHNQEWTVRNLIHIGRVETALKLARNLIELPHHPRYNTIERRGRSASYGRARLLDTLEDYELWEETIALASTEYLEPTKQPLEQIKRLRALGRAHHGLGDQPRLGGVVTTLEERLDLLETKIEELSSDEDDDEESEPDCRLEEPPIDSSRFKRSLEQGKSAIESALRELKVYQFLLEGNLEEAASALGEVRGLSKWRLAWLYFKAGELDKAQKIAAESVAASPGQVLPLAIQTAILQEAGDQEAALTAFEKLREQSGHIENREVRPFARLEPIARAAGFGSDWTVEKQESDDVGNRPSLDSLGPLFWEPPVAPRWELTDVEGNTISFGTQSQRPTLLIFYLGFGCLHCVEQLEAVGPRTSEFEQLGIEIIGIGTDDEESLKGSIQKYEGTVPFALLSNPQLDIFKEYRVFDDFESEPLHGTFLIDADGSIRWHDISYEPFTNVNFLLEEAQRLLNLTEDDDEITLSEEE